jgi:hypothetical protein
MPGGGLLGMLAPSDPNADGTTTPAQAPDNL